MGKLLKILALSTAMLLFTACVENGGQSNKKVFLYENMHGYSIEVPIGFSFSELSPNRDYYYFGYPASNELGLGSIEFHDTTSCAPDVLGISQPTIQEKGIAQGKVDYPLDYELKQLIPDCRPYKPDTVSYILCSEKNGKRIAICIFQVIDNPDLAEQIFRTFRWTD